MDPVQWQVAAPRRTTPVPGLRFHPLPAPQGVGATPRRVAPGQFRFYSFVQSKVSDPPRGCPVGGGGTLATGGMEASAPIRIHKVSQKWEPDMIPPPLFAISPARFPGIQHFVPTRPPSPPPSPIITDLRRKNH